MERFIARLLALRNRHFLVIDILIFLATPAIALALRIDDVPAPEAAVYWNSLPIVTAAFMIVKLATFYFGRLYTYFWRYASLDELGRIAWLGALALSLQTLVLLVVLRPLGLINADFPRSVPIIEGILALLAVGGVRYSVPIAERMLHKRSGRTMGTPVIVAGARGSGVTIVQEMQSNPRLGMNPVAFVDDDPEKLGTRIRGVPVLGKSANIAAVARDTGASQVVIAMPTARGKVIREIVSICEKEGLQTKIMPGVHEILSGTVSVTQLRDVQIEDLLRREPVHTDVTAVGALLRGKRVLVTGGGGSIGSELCRQVLQFEPESLIILGHGENSVFEIHSELTRTLSRGISAHNQTEEEQEVVALPSPGSRPNRQARTKLHTVIADIRFPNRMRAVFEEHRPHVVFHSAAHKHVPLMEENPPEAITNNVLGTRNLLDASLQVGVEQFVLISTDKAVNPTSVMGASKRVAELLVHQVALEHGKPYVAVRFGNVLGSRGSVVLTFKQQIAAGGPVTVTHPEMARFFMTIPEAVQLVLQAAPLGRSGEVFMLDMGEPVKIADLARDIIELSGLQVGRDIDIEFTGVRPGEKLYEELFVSGERYERTEHEKIFIAANASSFNLLPARLNEDIDELIRAAEANDTKSIIAILKRVVPEFEPHAEAPTTGTSTAGGAAAISPLAAGAAHPARGSRGEDEIRSFDAARG